MNTPTLLLLFNRPNLTSQLIKRLREIRPKKIYVNIDGPRKILIKINYYAKRF